MDKVFQVFVSSTFTDLEEERRLVSNSLAKAGYIAAGMELFPATDQDQFEFIKRIIDRSDYYVVITAGRYGSIASDGLSYTEKEFEYAKSKGIPVLAFPHKNPGSLAAEKWDSDTTLRDSLDRFNGKLKTGRVVDSWFNKDDLCTKVVIAVSNSVNLYPRVGWVRGDNAIDPKVLQETERLRIENNELKDRISKFQGSLAVEFDSSISGPDTAIEITIIETVHMNPHTQNITQTHSVRTSFKDIFLKMYEEILREPSENLMDRQIGAAFAITDGLHDGINHTNSCKKADTSMIRKQLEALGLIETKAKAGSMNSMYLAWFVSDKGRRYFASYVALKPT